MKSSLQTRLEGQDYPDGPERSLETRVAAAAWRTAVAGVNSAAKAGFAAFAVAAYLAVGSDIGFVGRFAVRSAEAEDEEKVTGCSHTKPAELELQVDTASAKVERLADSWNQLGEALAQRDFCGLAKASASQKRFGFE